MNAPAAIAASLVNMRNVGTHKSVALTIHVPEEQAQSVIAAFGWPTMAAPVPVAIARMNTETSVAPEADQDGEASPLGSADQRNCRQQASPSAPKKAWADLPASQQASIRCGEPEFRRFLSRYTGRAHYPEDEAGAAEVVKHTCGVESRRDLNTNHAARVIWHSMDTGYLQATGRMAVSR